MITSNHFYQVAFFPNGKGDSAICLRYKTATGYQTMIYDGGTAETGKEIVAYIRANFQTDTIEDVICSQPSLDHATGLEFVLQNFKVRQLWMHRPWNYSRIIEAHVNGTYFDAALVAHFSQHIDAVYKLDNLARKKNIPVTEPFEGAKIGPMTVLSPSADWYAQVLIPEFETPALVQHSMAPEVDYLLHRAGTPIKRRPLPTSSAKPESWKEETLPEWAKVRAEMESSVVLFGRIGHHGILFTGNAGIKALSNSAAYAESHRMMIPFHLRCLQVPHHGNRHHLSPCVLDRLVGPRLSEPTPVPWLTAFVFASANNRPDQCVVNALIRRGAEVAFINETQHQTHRFTQDHSDTSAEILVFQEDLSKFDKPTTNP